jgi:hypothetical protein
LKTGPPRRPRCAQYRRVDSLPLGGHALRRSRAVPGPEALAHDPR